jgi:hypothetical protein
MVLETSVLVLQISVRLYAAPFMVEILSLSQAVSKEKISGTSEKWAHGQSHGGGLYETSSISLHVFLCKNSFEEMNCKEHDVLCEPIEQEACYQDYGHPTLVQKE